MRATEDRHVLVHRLAGARQAAGAPNTPDRPPHAAASPSASGFSGSITSSGVVVLDLVVVPGRQPRAARVRRLQVRIALVQRVAGTVIREATDSRAGALVADARGRRRAGALVDVVAEVHDEVDVLLARGRRRRRSSRSCQFWHDVNAKRSLSTCAPAAGAVRVRPTALIARPHLKRYQYQRSEGSPAISAWTVWDSSQHRLLAAAAHDGAELRVGGDLVADAVGLLLHGAAVEGRALGQQPRPEHEAVRRGIAGGDAEAERVDLVPRRCGRRSCRPTEHEEARRSGAAGSEEDPAADPRVPAPVRLTLRLPSMDEPPCRSGGTGDPLPAA